MKYIILTEEEYLKQNTAEKLESLCEAKFEHPFIMPQNLLTFLLSVSVKEASPMAKSKKGKGKKKC